MVAPSNTKWGSTVGSYGRIGISVTLTNTSNTQTKRHTEIWFWSKYGLSDSSNTFYYDDQSSTATTSKGSVNIRTTVTSGNGWSTSNQVKIAEYDYTWTRGTSASKKNVAAKLSGIDRVGGTMTATTSYTIPAKPSYSIKYDANGGSGAPGNQTKWYGTTLKLSSTKPTRTGYTFQGWSTANDSSVEYASGANYTSNSAVTLYAVWKANTYTVSYDANGGSGAPGNQTKTYGVSLTLSSVIPTRTNYNFLGWGTSAGATTIAYEPGAAYTGNTALTLYAIWEVAYTPPVIDGFAADRCEADGALSDDGTYAKIVFRWKLDTTYSGGIQSIKIGYKLSAENVYTETQVSASGLEGSVSSVIGAGSLDTEYSYDVLITVTDDKGSSTAMRSVPACSYAIDLLAGGKGVAFNAPAHREGMDIHFDVMFDINKVLKGDDINFLGFRGDKSPLILNNIGLLNEKWLQGQMPSGSFLDILRVNTDGEVELSWTNSGLKGRAWKMIWVGTWTAGSITIPELPYYNLLLLRVQDGLTMIPAWRSATGSSLPGVRGDTFRGIGGYAYKAQDGDHSTGIYAFNGKVTDGPQGITLNMEKSHYWATYYSPSNNNANIKAPQGISNIIGVI